MINAPSERVNGTAERSIGADPEQPVEHHERAARDVLERKGGPAMTSGGVVKFALHSRRPFFIAERRDEEDLPAAVREVPGCDECIAAIIPFAKYRHTDSGSRKKLPDRAGGLCASLLHKNIRRDSVGECFLFEGLHCCDAEDHDWMSAINTPNSCGDGIGQSLAVTGTSDFPGFVPVGQEAEFAKNGGHPGFA